MSSLSSRVCKFSPMLSSESFIVTFMSTIHSELTLVQSSRFRLGYFFFFFFAYGYAIASVPFAIKTVLPLLDYFCTSVKNQLAILVWVNFWILNFVPITYVSVPLSVSRNLNHCSYIISFEIRKSDFSHLFLYLKILLVILVLLPCHINFRIILSISTKNLFGILMGILLNLYINLGGLASLLYWLIFQTLDTVSLSI